MDDHARADVHVVPRSGSAADLVRRRVAQGHGLVRLAVGVRDDDRGRGDLRDRPFQLAQAAVGKKKLWKEQQRAEKKSFSVHLPERNSSSSFFSFRSAGEMGFICFIRSSSAGVSFGRWPRATSSKLFR